MPEIKNYAYRLHGGPAGAGDGVRAHIHLFDASNHMVGRLYFYDAANALLPDAENDGVITLAYTIDRLSEVVDLLRNEKPIYLHWQETSKNGFIGTGQEPVGEGE